MSPTEVRGMWNLLLQSWGQKFAEQYGAQPNEAWVSALGYVSVDAGRHAYVTAMRETPTFPPTLPEFVACALGTVKVSPVAPAKFTPFSRHW